MLGVAKYAYLPLIRLPPSAADFRFDFSRSQSDDRLPLGRDARYCRGQPGCFVYAREDVLEEGARGTVPRLGRKREHVVSIVFRLFALLDDDAREKFNAH